MTETEENMLRDYVIKMTDMGYGLSKDDILRTAFQILEKSKRPHPFINGLLMHQVRVFAHDHFSKKTDERGFEKWCCSWNNVYLFRKSLF